VQRGNLFADTSTRARATIAELGARFIRRGSVILVHGYSRVVLALLRQAVSSVSRVLRLYVGAQVFVSSGVSRTQWGIVHLVHEHVTKVVVALLRQAVISVSHNFTNTALQQGVRLD
jgi:hypothetical protein